MTKLYNSIIIFLSAFFLISCDSKKAPVDDLDDLTEEISENSKDYSDKDWEEAALQYQQIETELEKYHSEYTDAELKEIGKKKGKCLALFTKHSVINFKENMEDVMHEATGIIEGFSEGLNE